MFGLCMSTRFIEKGRADARYLAVRNISEMINLIAGQIEMYLHMSTS